MKITVELIQNDFPDDAKHNGWCVSVSDKYADGLSYDEALGLLASLIVPEDRRCMQWLKTKEQHETWSAALKKASDNSKREHPLLLPESTSPKTEQP